MKRALQVIVAAAAFGGLLRCSVGFDPDRPRAYKCVRGDDLNQCGEGWHCGTQGFCYDLSVPFPHPCGRDGGGDCAPGWRCGLEALCHDQDAGTAYLCAFDPDCERGWRCGPDGRCVDPFADALRPITSAGVAERLSPRALAQAPELASFAPERVSFTNFGAFSWIADGALVHVLQQSATQGPTSHYRYQAGGAPLSPGSGAARALLTIRLRSFVADELGVAQYDFAPDGGVLGRLPLPAMTNAQLRLSDDEVPLLVSFNAEGFSLMQLDAGTAMGPLVFPSADGGAGRLLDMDFAFTPADLVAATDEGLFLAPTDGLGRFRGRDGGPSAFPDWWPIQTSSLPNSQCGGGEGDRPVRVHPVQLDSAGYGGWALVVEVEPRDGLTGPAEHRAFVYGRQNDGGAARCLDSDGTSRLRELSSPCAPCQFGPTNSLQPLVDPDGGLRYEALCGQAGGTSSYLVQVAAGSCAGLPFTSPPSFSLEPVRHSRASMSFGTYSSSRGQLWLVDPHSAAKAFVLDRVPDAVAGRGDALRVFAGEEYQLDEGLGLAHQPPPAGFRYAHAPVQGRDGWLVVSDPAGQAGLWVAAMNEDGTNGSLPVNRPAPFVQVRSPITGAAAVLPGGEVVVLVSVYDALLASGADGQLSVVAVPLTQEPITSIAPLPSSPDAGVLLSSYVLAQGRLFRVSAPSETVWRSDEILLPPGVPLEVWADGARGRVGYTDGKVYSLPSRVQIGRALSAAESPVVDYAQVCGQSYALSKAGLFSLVLDGGSPIGAWERDSRIDALLPAWSNDYGYAGGRLHAGKDELLLFTSFGSAARVTVSCP